MAVSTVLTAPGSTGNALDKLMIRQEARVRFATGGGTEGMEMFPGSSGLRGPGPVQGSRPS